MSSRVPAWLCCLYLVWECVQSISISFDIFGCLLSLTDKLSLATHGLLKLLRHLFTKTCNFHVLLDTNGVKKNRLITAIETCSFGLNGFDCWSLFSCLRAYCTFLMQSFKYHWVGRPSFASCCIWRVSSAKWDPPNGHSILRTTGLSYLYIEEWQWELQHMIIWLALKICHCAKQYFNFVYCAPTKLISFHPEDVPFLFILH